MKIEITIPSSLSEIPLCRYQAFIKMRNSSTDEELIAYKMISLLCDVPLATVSKMSLISVNDLILHLGKIFEEKPKFRTTFKMNGKEFGFIPDLEAIQLDEYITLEKHLTDWENYNKAMAVMYRPILSKHKSKYEIAPFDSMPEMDEVMKYVPLDIAMSSSVFFWTLEMELLEGTLRYLETEIMKDKTLKTNIAQGLNLANGGGGIPAFMHSLRENLQSLTTSYPCNYLNVSTI